MHRDNDQINALFLAEHSGPLFRFADRFAQRDLRVVALGIVQARHPRRCQSDYADADTVHLLDDEGLKVCFSGSFLVGVCREPGESSFTARFVEHIEAEFVFVVADSHCVVTHGAHHRHHRIGQSVVYPGVMEGQRRALYRIAGIEQQQAGILLARLFHYRRNAGQSAHVRFVCVVVDRENVAVQVRGRKNRDVCPGRPVCAAIRSAHQQHKCSDQAREHGVPDSHCSLIQPMIKYAKASSPGLAFSSASDPEAGPTDSELCPPSRTPIISMISCVSSAQRIRFLVPVISLHQIPKVPTAR